MCEKFFKVSSLDDKIVSYSHPSQSNFNNVGSKLFSLRIVSNVFNGTFNFGLWCFVELPAPSFSGSTKIWPFEFEHPPRKSSILFSRWLFLILLSAREWFLGRGSNAITFFAPLIEK